MKELQTMQVLLSLLLILCGYWMLMRVHVRHTAALHSPLAIGAVVLIIYTAFAAAFCLVISLCVGQGLVLPALLLMVFAMAAASIRTLSGSWREVRPLPAVLLLAWLLIAMYLTLFTREGGSRTEILVQFSAIAEAVRERSLLPLQHFGQNVILFVPLGMLLPLAGRRVRWFDSAFAGLLLTSAIESVQLLWQLGLCDVEDLTANLLGALLGHVLCRVFFPARREHTS